MAPSKLACGSAEPALGREIDVLQDMGQGRSAREERGEVAEGRQEQCGSAVVRRVTGYAREIV